MAFSGPFAHLKACTFCQQPRYDPDILASSQGKKKVPQKQYLTLPLGPQLQALWRTPEGARNMRYRSKLTKEILEKAKARPDNNIVIEEYEDVFHGEAYLNAVKDGRITDDDMVLMISIDGAQLYQMKQSTCWIYIWIILDLAPDLRYKKRHVLVGGVIPGPNKPKNIESFLFPGFHHVAALSKEGLSIWDALENRVAVEYKYWSCAFGCRIFCPVPGRRKPGGNHYYPALLKPHGNYTVAGCDHPDIDPRYLPGGNPQEYQKALKLILESSTTTFEGNQKKTARVTRGYLDGYPYPYPWQPNPSNPRVFRTKQAQKLLIRFGRFWARLRGHGYRNRYPYPYPSLPNPCTRTGWPYPCISLALNIPDLILDLWRGKLDCDPDDDRKTWDWAVLVGEVWEDHGREVAAATPYLPGSFDRPPRNPAEKISSGYKAWEFLTYVYGLGPGLFYKILPHKYWKNFCKLVAGVRLLHQRRIPKEQLIHGHNLLLEFVTGFEDLYYQQKSSRIHFCRQSIHALLHIGPEIPRLGPAVVYTQWPLERTIGNLGEEIRQPSNFLANIIERAARRAQVNSLLALIPELADDKPQPRISCDLGASYMLSMRERFPHVVTATEREAVCTFFSARNIALSDDALKIQKWARLQLQNMQFVRTAWKEAVKPLEKVRTARNVMFYQNASKNMPYFAEVQYFFMANINGSEQGLALVSVYGDQTVVNGRGLATRTGLATVSTLQRRICREKCIISAARIDVGKGGRHQAIVVVMQEEKPNVAILVDKVKSAHDRVTVSKALFSPVFGVKGVSLTDSTSVGDDGRRMTGRAFVVSMQNRVSACQTVVNGRGLATRTGLATGKRGYG
ncbi:hypothetical protein CPC08DRAFT_753019 [Agrocybe pediades]|nr:hypothetical protein CPC08DRAFT_753019 [Agrocybe pediades]